MVVILDIPGSGENGNRIPDNSWIANNKQTYTFPNNDLLKTQKMNIFTGIKLTKCITVSKLAHCSSHIPI